MESFKSSLKELIHVTKAGTEHPYCGVHSTRYSANMLARITSYPPLGDDTIVKHGQDAVTFHVLFESASSPQNIDISCPWDIEVWHNSNDENTWTSLPLKLTTSSAESEIFQLDAVPKNIGTVTYHLSATLTGRPKESRPVSFTIRFRASSQESWKWARDQSGVDDGKILYQQKLQKPELAQYLYQLSPDLRIASEKSQATDTFLWSIQGDVNAAQGDKSGFTTHSLGFPTNVSRWFSLVRYLSCWMAPHHGKGRPLANKDAIMYSFQRNDGCHLVLLAISGVENVNTVFQYQNNTLTIRARNDSEGKGTTRVLAAVGYSFDNAAAAVMYRAREIVTDPGLKDLLEEYTQRIEAQQTDDVKANWVEDWYDGFTYCTWNGLGKNLTEEKILSALESLHDHGIRVTNLIIDDNWQSLDNLGKFQMLQGWTEFEANKEGFPNGLKAAISNIRSKYPDLAHIGVWHAILGYWGGISPTGKIAKEYKTVEVKKSGGFFGDSSYFVDASDVSRFYNDFYSFLTACGVDSVKTDVQNMLDEIDSAPYRRSLTMTYINTWIIAQLKHLYGHAISCMSQAPANLFRAQLPNNIPRLCVRNSDDFFPDVEESHPWHIFCNAHNSLFTKYLNVLPDWDMFQTSHPWAAFHAAARTVSGGPIYITDEPGKHNVDLIRQMTAQTIRDQTVILRPSVVGRSTNTYIGYQEQRLLRVGAYDGAAERGSSFLAIFNCHDGAIQELVPFTEFLGIEKGTYVVRSYRAGACAIATGNSGLLKTTIQGRGWELISATPAFTVEGIKNFQCGNLGLINKLTGAAAILSTTVTRKQSDCISVKTSLKALGTLGLYISRLPQMDLEKKLMVLIEGHATPFHCVSASSKDANVLEVDLERAWKELKLKVSYSNELSVETLIYVS